MTTSTPEPEINGLYDKLNEARGKAWAEANDAHMRTRRIAEETDSDPSASELIGLAAIEAVIQLTRIFRGNWCGLGLMSSYVAG